MKDLLRAALMLILFALPLARAGAAGERCVALFRPDFLFSPSGNLSRLLNNISPADARSGVVVASPSRTNPPYYFHWVRDAGLVMNALLDIYDSSTRPVERQILRRRLLEYGRLSGEIQRVPTRSDLGEPKFNVDGSSYDFDWGRPQNDGPALRALSLIRWYHLLETEGEKTRPERARLYTGDLRAGSVIKNDLEYVSHHWREPCFDLWEEVYGDHFYTRMVQRRALLEGADLARSLGDPRAAEWYSRQVKEIETTLADFWSAERGYFVATLNRAGGADYKNSNLDVGVVLGLLHGSVGDGFLAWDDPRILATLEKIETVFARLYPINSRAEIPGVAIGRYPEDRYSGDGFDGGNPWPLVTLAMAEAYYRIARVKAQKGKSLEARTLIAKGDSFAARVRSHAHADGSLNEQMNRETGFMQGARDLTWNYAAVVTAASARRAAEQTRESSPQ